ncbi:unnamed protein product [Agarophyton chilense]
MRKPSTLQSADAEGATQPPTEPAKEPSLEPAKVMSVEPTKSPCAAPVEPPSAGLSNQTSARLAAAFLRVPTVALSSAAVLFDSVAVAAWRTGRLGNAPLSVQIFATLFVLSWLPYLYRTQLHSRFPRSLFAVGAACWCLGCALPSFWALLLELFTGHRRPGASWVEGVVRVYAIMLLWIFLAVFNERIVRPWWIANSDTFLARFRANSVASQAHDMAVNRRASVLDDIMQQMVIISKRKILASRTLQAKSTSIEEARKNMIDLKNDLKVEKEKVASEDNQDDKQRYLENVQQLMDQVFEAVNRVDDLRTVERVLKQEVQLCERQLESLQHRWEQSLHIENHTRFYR